MGRPPPGRRSPSTASETVVTPCGIQFVPAESAASKQCTSAPEGTAAALPQPPRSFFWPDERSTASAPPRSSLPSSARIGAARSGPRRRSKSRRFTAAEDAAAGAAAARSGAARTAPGTAGGTPAARTASPPRSERLKIITGATYPPGCPPAGRHDLENGNEVFAGHYVRRVNRPPRTGVMDGRLPGRPSMTRAGQRRRHVPESDFDASLSEVAVSRRSARRSAPCPAFAHTSALVTPPASAAASSLGSRTVQPRGAAARSRYTSERIRPDYGRVSRVCVVCPGMSDSAPRSHRQLPFREDDAVLVAVEPVARTELHPAERDRHVHLAGAVLGALAGVGAQGLHSEVQLPQRRHVPDRAVDDRAGPAVRHGRRRDH